MSTSVRPGYFASDRTGPGDLGPLFRGSDVSTTSTFQLSYPGLRYKCIYGQLPTYFSDDSPSYRRLLWAPTSSLCQHSNLNLPAPSLPGPPGPGNIPLPPPNTSRLFPVLLVLFSPPVPQFWGSARGRSLMGSYDRPCPVPSPPHEPSPTLPIPSHTRHPYTPPSHPRVRSWSYSPLVPRLQQLHPPTNTPISDTPGTHFPVAPGPPSTLVPAAVASRCSGVESESRRDV